MQFDLVSPERRLASMEATSVLIPGAEGDFTAMADHAALITTLRPGLLKVVSGSDTNEYVVTGGFVEVNATAASVLAERAIPRQEASRDVIDELIALVKRIAARHCSLCRGSVSHSMWICLPAGQAKLWAILHPLIFHSYPLLSETWVANFI